MTADPGSGAIRVALSVGANLGDREDAVAAAVRALAQEPGVSHVVVSSLYETAPVGGVEQPDFLNVVVIADVDGPPGSDEGATDRRDGCRDAAGWGDRLLVLAHDVEAAHQRRRDVRWGPRTLDVDILAVGDRVSDDPRLTLPHPRISERAFVLVPWGEVDPDFGVAGTGRTVGELRDALSDADRAGVRRRPDPLSSDPADWSSTGG